MPNATRYANKRFEKHLESTTYQQIKVKTSGRTIHEASDNAFTSINLLRGIWNLVATFGAWRYSFSEDQKPLGVVHKGPISTLHHLDGKLVDDVYWYEPSFLEETDLWEPKDGWRQLEENRRHVMSRMKHYGYRKDLESILVRYAVALDNGNLSVAFLQLWSLLEKVTDTIGSNYDETIRRTTWGWEDRQEAAEMLNFLRSRRNQFVHSAAVGKSHDQATYLMKHMLEPHLMRLVRNSFEVESLEEYGKYLSLPSTVDSLEKQKRRLGHALRTLKEWQKP
jgi:hypothetical protein